MRYYALATDFDDTIALHGKVEDSTFAALERLKASGRKLLLVTGRELPELLALLPNPQLFDRIVAENGAVLLNPATGQIRPIARPPPPEFLQYLRERKVEPLSAGYSIVATREPYEVVALQGIRELGLEYHVIFNKGAVMVLPSGVNKATGLKPALKELELSPHNVVAIGDAENDHAFLEYCELGAAVANALPALKDRADLVMKGERGAGVEELVELMLNEESHRLIPRRERSSVALGTAGGNPLLVPGYGTTILLAGSSGGGKSTFVTGFLERLFEKRYQACIVDPEGDYPELEQALVLGDGKRTPGVPEIVKNLGGPSRSVVVNFMGLSLADRPPFFQSLLTALLEMRSHTGRPHWIIADEMHHLMPSSW